MIFKFSWGIMDDTACKLSADFFHRLCFVFSLELNYLPWWTSWMNDHDYLRKLSYGNDFDPPRVFREGFEIMADEQQL